MIAEADITLARGGVDIDAQSTDAAFALKEWHMPVCLGVFLGNAKVYDSWLQDNALPGNLEHRDLVVLLGIKCFVDVGRECLAEANVVTVGAKACGIEWLNDDIAILNCFADRVIGENHFLKESGG